MHQTHQLGQTNVAARGRCLGAVIVLPLAVSVADITVTSITRAKQGVMRFNSAWSHLINPPEEATSSRAVSQPPPHSHCPPARRLGQAAGSNALWQAPGAANNPVLLSPAFLSRHSKSSAVAEKLEQLFPLNASVSIIPAVST